MRGWVFDLTYALRLLGKSPGFTLLAVICLGCGIGVNAAIFSLLNYLFLRPLPVDQPDRVMVLSRGNSPIFSFPDYRDFRDRSRTLDGMAASAPTESSLEVDGSSQLASAERVSVNYAEVLGVHPYLGRWFQSDDEPSAVISYRTWQRLFHSDPQVIGRLIRSETQSYTVVGVAPKEFGGIYLPLAMDIWVPARTWAKQYPTATKELEDRGRTQFFVFGRLKPGTSTAQAAGEMNSIARQIQAEHPAADARVQPIGVEQVRGVPSVATRRTAAPVTAVLMGFVGLILLIACVNVGNLLLARSASRRRELAMRVALGAGRIRLLRQLLTESLLLAMGGGAAGMLLGIWTNRLLSHSLASGAGPYETFIALDLTSDSRVLAFTAALSLLTTLLFGLAPAWRASRTDVVSVLKGETPSGGASRLRRVSLVAQVSLSLVLLLTAGLFLRVMLRFQASDPGFEVQNRLYLMTYAPAPEFNKETGRRFYAQLTGQLRNLPGVRNAAVTQVLPMTPVPPDCASAPDGERFSASAGNVSPGFLATMGIPLLAGRDFSAADTPSSVPVAIVNVTLAARLWPGQTALGKRVLLGCRNPVTLEVVGVARDTRTVSLGEAPKPHVYRPLEQTYGGVQNVVVETAASPAAMVETVRHAILAAGPGVRVYVAEPMSDWIDRSYFAVKWEVGVLGAFAALALLLAAVGLYGVIAYHVALRTREIGVRMALGARPGEVLGLVLRQGLGLTVLGVGIGLLVSAGLTRLMAGLLYGVSPTDPATYAGASALWLAVAVAACYLPARRAARVDPMVALRHD